MKKMTEENLRNVFAGESQAHMKYLAFAEKASKESFLNVARLFRASAFSEQAHAINHLRTLAGIENSAENLKKAEEGEMFEVEEMYPAYIHVAEAQNEKAAQTSMRWAYECEKVHAGLYKKAIAAINQGLDLEFMPIHVCQVCGFAVEGEAPEKCPVCGSLKEKFTRF